MSCLRNVTLLCAALMAPPLVVAQTVEAPWVAEARQVSMAVPPKLLLVLQAEIARAGPEGAIEACRVEAPQLARAASQESGWSVRRVSLRNRNPKAAPDAWERAALEDFDRRAAAGEAPGKLEAAAVVNVDGACAAVRAHRAQLESPGFGAHRVTEKRRAHGRHAKRGTLGV